MSGRMRAPRSRALGAPRCPRRLGARKRREPLCQERGDDEHGEVDGRTHEHRPAQAEGGEQQEGGGQGARDGARGVGRVEEPDAASDLLSRSTAWRASRGSVAPISAVGNSRITKEHTR